MKFLLTILSCCLSLASLPAYAISFDEARHLLARTGFGGNLSEIRRLEPLGYEQAVDSLLNSTGKKPVIQPPRFERQHKPRKFKDMSKEERKSLRKQRRERLNRLKAWWYQEMIQTDSPLTERMVMFWHGHFTSAAKKVKFPVLMQQQNQLFRENALGSYAKLLRAIVRDPAMLLYLDNQSNTKKKPNENLARELLELFSLGEGHYSEQDIKEAARALTGWRVKRKTGEFTVVKRMHDSGQKTFMGRRGNWDGEDIVNIILQQPLAAEYIAAKLRREFITTEPKADEVRELAQSFMRSGYEIKPLLKTILMSEAFRDPANHATRIKSPVELIVGTVRLFEIPVKNPGLLALAGRKLGQDVFDPPNVKGWPSGNDWINSESLLARQQLISRLLRGREMDNQPASLRTAGKSERRHQFQKRRRFMQDLFEKWAGQGDMAQLQRTVLALSPVNPVDPGADMRTQIEQWLQDPVYQLN